MKMLHLLPLLSVAVVACGSDPVDKSFDEPTNSVDQPNNEPIDQPNNKPIDQPNNEPIDQPNNEPNNEPIGAVTVDCVSDLVTSGGNYYALSAEVSDAGALVEMVQYYAATPTSDPVESVIYSDSVDAQYDALQFAFEVDDIWLDVARDDERAMFTGTMSGETEFGEAVPVTCWADDYELPATYDPATGDCVDADGNSAENELPFMYAVRTGFGQCARFEGTLNQEALGYPVFDFIDLRGADLNDAVLSFANLERIQFEGADLRQFEFGYATVSGTIDAFTRLPEVAQCEVPEGATEFECTR